MRWPALLLTLALGSMAERAWAQPAVDPATLTPEQKEQANRLADEGARAFDAGDFATAKDKFEQAEAIIAIPPFTYQKGRALERLGRWAEALACYEQVASVTLGPTAPGPHILAKRESEKARDALAPKLPRLTVTTVGGAAAEVYIDGRAAGTAGPTAKVVDPGEHVIEVRGVGGTVGRRTIQLRPSESMSVELPLALPADPNLPQQDTETPLWTILGWTGVGVGGASLIVALATGIPAIMKRSDLDTACPDGRCPPSVHGDVDTYDSLRWAAGGTLIAGLIVGGAGAAVLILDANDLLDGLVRAEVGPTYARLTVSLP